jgi:acetyltransferase-like isoleucine patch superfamily enzyme
MIRKIINFIEGKVFRTHLSIWRTLWLNFRTLPLRQAIKCPLRVYGKIQLACLQGRIEFGDEVCITKFGLNYSAYRNVSPGRISILKGGVFVINRGIRVSQGVCICIGTNARLEMCENASLGDSAMVVCMKSVKIGKNSSVTWQCQLMDYNSHFIQLADGSIPTIYKSVVIGDYCWVGNRTSIQPGTKLPNRTIVTSNSLLNKDYTSTIEKYCLIGGQPAKLLRSNVKRIYENSLANELDKHYRTTDTPYIINGISKTV